MNTQLDYQIGKELFKYIRKQNQEWKLLNFDWLKNQILKFSIQDRKLQNQLFRFVDVLPSLKTQEQRLDYFLQYLKESNSLLLQASSLAAHTPIIKEFMNWVIGLSVTELAKTFICGSNVTEAQVTIAKLKKKNQSYTLDLLGESTLNQKEAEGYFNHYLNLLNQIPNINISIKLSALEPQLNPLDFQSKKENLKNKLRIIFREAILKDAVINIDTEHYYWKDFSFELIRELLNENEFKTWRGAGIVVQAYLKDSEKDLQDWINWAKKRGTPVTIRLVKGAYWDYEYAKAKQQNWDSPVFTEKYLSDINYEKLSEILLDNHRYLRPALASHNVRSLAHALAYAQEMQIDKANFEIQMLYGMLDELKNYFSENGYTLKVYLPYGDLVQGMSYLVRRLLENTANDSFLKQGFLDGKSEDILLEDPSRHYKEIATLSSRAHNDAEDFSNTPNSDFSKKDSQKAINEAIQGLRSQLNEDKLYPLIIGSEKILNNNYFETINPAMPNKSLGRISHSTLADCDKAIHIAGQSFEKWSQVSVETRAKILFACAQALEQNRMHFNALLCLEAGKPWLEADGEVSEAVDFLNYYAKQAIELFGENKLRSLAGEKNTNIYQAYGVSTVIPPWNFPLAILVGMASASLASGNTVIIKPSQQTSLIAYEFVSLFNKALKDLHQENFIGIINFLAGEGKVIGSYLVEHPQVKLIAFTGSNATGMDIYNKASQARPPKRVIAEMGGKNAIIIDDSADLDEAIPGVLYSAFGYAGQKCSACSRIIILENVYQDFIDRLSLAAREIKITDPSDNACYLAPVIDYSAQSKIIRYIELGKQEGKLLVGDLALPEQGCFVSPTIFSDIAENSKLAQEEIFGPVLIAFKARDFDQALAIANNSQFGLTGGLYSRSPRNIDKAIKEFTTGNLYINRSCTGAIVSRQAFGGLKNSSIGFKAGGPNYLLQFVQEKTITENTMRRGFAAD